MELAHSKSLTSIEEEKGNKKIKKALITLTCFTILGILCFMVGLFYGFNAGLYENINCQIIEQETADPDFEIREELDYWERRGQEPEWIKERARQEPLLDY